jgi:hypothetical protein
VTSPTFTLVQEHDTVPPLAHADLYRLTGPEQLRELGLDAQRDDGRLLLVEWGEPYIAQLGGDALVLSFALDPRRAIVSATGRRSSAILAELIITPTGVGDLITYNRSVADYPAMFAAILSIILVASVSVTLLQHMERRLFSPELRAA